MKRKKIIAIIIALLLFASSAFAILPALAVIAPQLIGATLATVLVGGAVTKIAQSPAGTFTADGSLLKVPIVAYNSFMQAGAQVALGYAASIPWDFKTAWNTGAFSPFPAIQTVAQQTFPASPPLPTGGSVIAGSNTAGYNTMLTGSWTDSGAYYGGAYFESTYAALKVPGMTHTYYESGSIICRLDWSDQSPTYAGYYRKYWITYNLVAVGDAQHPVNYPPPVSGVPQTLSTEQAAQLAANIAAAQADNAIKQALKDAVAANPGLLTPSAVSGAAIPAPAVQEYASKQADAAKQTQIDNLTTAAAANPTDTNISTALEEAKAEQAKAKADEVKAQADNTAAAPKLPAIQTVTLDLQPLIDAKNATMQKAPFSFLYAIPGILAPLYRTPVAPAFDIDLGFHTVHVDFSPLNWFAATVRSIFGFFLYLGLIWKAITQFSRM